MTENEVRFAEKLTELLLKAKERKNVLNFKDFMDSDQDVMEDSVSHQCGECHHVVHINTKKENVNAVK